MTRKERPVPFPKDIYTGESVSQVNNATHIAKLTHGNTQQADAYLDATDDDHGMLDSPVGKPFIGEKSQDKTEHIFEN